MDLLVVEGVKKHFGGIRAVDGVSLRVRDKSITALIGPNGSGKTTFFNVISGFYPADAGLVMFKEHRVIDVHAAGERPIILQDGPQQNLAPAVHIIGTHNLSPYAIAELGMVRTFQIVKLFRTLSVIENMLAAPGRRFPSLARQAVTAPFTPIVSRLIRPPVQPRTGFRLRLTNSRLKAGEFLAYYKRTMAEERELYDKALQLLEMLQILHLKDELAGNLSGGQMKLLTLGMTLMRDPEMLLLDEPVAGVNPTLANKIFDIIISLRDRLGKTFLIVEHNMDVVLGFSETIYVMNRGRILARGHPEEIMANRQVIDAYLGGH